MGLVFSYGVGCWFNFEQDLARVSLSIPMRQNKMKKRINRNLLWERRY